MPFLTDEHVPSVFVTTLRSHGCTVSRAKDEFEEGTLDDELLVPLPGSDFALRYVTGESTIMHSRDRTRR